MSVLLSDFSNGREAWAFDGDTSNVDYRARGEFIRGGEGGLFFEGGREWSGAFGEATNGTLSFRIRQDGIANSFDSGARVEIVGANGDVLSVTFDVAGNGWNTISLDLNPFGGWRINNGSIASEDQIRSVLSDMADIRISGDFRTGDTYTDLDDVQLTAGDDPDRGDRVFNDFYNEVRSTFKFGGEGWSFINDVSDFSHLETGGQRNGFIEAVDRASGLIMYYIAPDEFTGQKEGFLGGRLNFSLKIESFSSASLGGDEVIIVGANGTTITWDAGFFPGSDWTQFSVRLNADAGWEVEGGGVATRADIQGVLEDIAELRIRGEFVNGGETSGLDSVSLLAPDRGYDVFTRGDVFLESFNDLQDALDSLSDLQRRVLITEDTDGDFQVTSRNVSIDDPLDLFDGRFTLDGAAVFNVSGGEGVTITGDDGGNTIFVEGTRTAEVLAGGGEDTITFGDTTRGVIRAGDGKDQLFGGNGRDRLFGGGKKDFLVGAGGNDTLVGGGGADQFVFNGVVGWDNDKINDFQSGLDKIIFIDLNTSFGITEFSDLDGLWGQSVADTLTLTIGENIIRFRGFTDESQLSADDFTFITA